ncbi:hypothetical protein BKA82DRAFT_4189883 [Pisolithus tinctorius]|nr:hypothetical protein BKA82DRAFT_4189883 [Pisolithus tinctorius]
MIKPQHEAYPGLHSPRLPQILPDHRDLADSMSTQGFNTFTSLVVASHVLFMYDYALTLSKEIDLFWFQDRWNWAFAFFIANRYIALFGRIPEFFWLFFPNNSGLDNSVCSGLLLAGEVTMGVLQIIGEVVMTARVYAIYNRDRRIVSLLVVAVVIAQGLYCWAVLYRPPPSQSEQIATSQGTLAGCPNPMTLAEASYWAAAWGGQLFFDAVVFILTLKKLISIHSLGRRTFMSLLLRDGVMYFAIMTAANGANITTYFVMADPFNKAMLSALTNM